MKSPQAGGGSLYEATVGEAAEKLLPPGATLPSDADREAARQNHSAYVRARDSGHLDYVRDATRFDKFYMGDQWDEADRKRLAEENRPALTINKILPTVNALLGEQSMKQVDFQAKARHDGDPTTAAAITKLLMHISEQNVYEHLEGMMFADGLIQERGYLDIRVLPKKNLRGEIEITCEDPLSIIPDPDAREYDPAKWKEFFKDTWMSLEDIEITYGAKKAQELRGVLGTLETWNYDTVQMRSASFGDTKNQVEIHTDEKETRFFRSIRVTERQRVVHSKVWFFVDPQTGEERQANDGWDDDRKRAFAKQMGLFLYSKIAPRIRWTVSAGAYVLLHDDWSPYKTFTIIPYFPYFRRGRPFGVVRNLVSPQEALNKSESQELHIVNTTANSGWIVEEGALVNMTANDLRTHGSKTGLVITVAPGRRDGIDKITPNQVPSGIDRISVKSANNIKEISAVGDGMLGLSAGPEVSGVSLEHNRQQGLMQIQMPLENLRFTRKLVGRKILELVQQFYVEERVFRIINDQDADAADEELIINLANAAGQIVNDVTVGEYEVVVTTQPARDVFHDTQFAEILALRGHGVFIPDDEIVTSSNLARRVQIAERIRQLQGTAEPSEEEIAHQQQQQELMSMAQQLELEKLGAEIQEIHARAAQAMAKAQADGTTDERLMAELESDIQKKREELGLRLQLAQIASTSKERIKAAEIRFKHAGDQLDRTQARLLAFNKPPTGKP